MTVLSHEEKRRKRQRAEQTRRIRELTPSGRSTAGFNALPIQVKQAA